MKEATRALKAKLEKQPELKKQYTQQQLEDIFAEKKKLQVKYGIITKSWVKEIVQLCN